MAIGPGHSFRIPVHGFGKELAEEWNSDAHVVVQKGAQTVTFSTQVDYLLGYAQSFISSAAAPEEPEFPGGKKPLLFRLLKDAIYRTGVDEDTGTTAIFEMAEVTARPDLSTRVNSASCHPQNTAKIPQVHRAREGFYVHRWMDCGLGHWEEAVLLPVTRLCSRAKATSFSKNSSPTT